ncbi:aminoglycoside resistance protein [Arthrobacter alpinus]|uniref:aminoglycoside phosphotransferase family protein n=1 Tax=Arthrobacter alpinus TaxID=656366 RepID=UPI0005CA22F1|nr:aminoglycoside phosphotransferase family protein [Arthrobacter alpinus]ALV44754.1 aminoglycoside resistance protein [Arthrobacter alpinus]
MRVEIPEPLRLRHRRTSEGRAWVDKLPVLIEQAVAQWHLRVDLPAGKTPWHGNTGIVIPVLTQAGVAAALKIAFPFDEALLEPVALQLWDGHGMVRIIEDDESIGATLMERLDSGRSLMQLPMDEAIATWGALVRNLSIRPDDRPGWQRIPHIAGTAERYCDELPQRWGDLYEPFPRWLLEAALEVCQIQGAVGRRSNNDVLVHTDLHYLNILAKPGSADYVAIDPQAQLGDGEFGVAPCLWNRLGDLPERNSEAALRRRSSELAQAAGLSEDLAAAWAVVREVENALWYLENSRRSGDAQRSLWVASTMAGKTLPGLPGAHELRVLS